MGGGGGRAWSVFHVSIKDMRRLNQNRVCYFASLVFPLLSKGLIFQNLFIFTALSWC